MVGLINSCVPFGSTVSFLVSSPLLNPVIVSLFAAFFGWRVAMGYVATCFTLAVLSGALWERMDLADQVKRVRVMVAGHADDDRATGAQGVLGRAFSAAIAQFRDALPYLMVGVVIASVIYGFVPTELIPIGMVLMQKGMSLGALMALIIGGAGASIPEISLLASIFKPRLVMVFVVTVFVVAVTAGFVLGAIA